MIDPDSKPKVNPPAAAVETLKKEVVVDEPKDEVEVDSLPEVPYDGPSVNSQPVSAVPTPGAVSDPKPEQTDNSERPEDGEQDVSQDKNEVPSEDDNLEVD